MIIAVPLDEDRNMLHMEIANCPHFMIVDTNKDTLKIVDNPAIKANEEKERVAAEFVVSRNADAIIAVRLGNNAMDIFRLADVSVYKADGDDAKDNLRKRAQGGLLKL